MNSTNDIMDRIFRVIAFCLDDEGQSASVFDGLNWKLFFRFCKRNTIDGVVFAGMKRYNERTGEKLPIDVDTLTDWYAAAEGIKRRNAQTDLRACEAMKYFTDNGFRCCILKGQGNAQMYDDPESRSPGDVDVWLDGTKKEIVDFVHTVFPTMNVQYHHMNFHLFEDINVEVHYKPSYCYNKWHNHYQQDFYKRHADEVFNNRVLLPSCGETICAPTKPFNLIFMLSHTMRHFFTQGVGVRHAVDYYYLLKQDFTDEEKKEFVKELHRCGMYKFFCALMWIETEKLGLKKNTDIAPANKSAGKLLLHEMLKAGDMGHYYKHNVQKTPLRLHSSQMLYNLRYIMEFPSEPLSRPFTLVWDYIRKHIVERRLWMDYKGGFF
jgi:hypothetical protein